jgi:N-hydroxyarylamine O-acetyltransferase
VRTDQPYAHFGWTYMLKREGDAWVLRTKEGEGWTDLYAFTLERQFPIDYEVANHYTSTHPSSRFVQILTAQRVTEDTRHVLRNADYEVQKASGERTARKLGSHDELLALLAETFGLTFPAGSRFPLDFSGGGNRS